MTTIKSYTDIKQSRKLAEILPLESADMYWLNKHIDLTETKYEAFIVDKTNKYIDFFKSYAVAIDKNEIIPCWSLAALLTTLPNEIITDNRFECHYQIDIRKYDGSDNTTLYQIAYGNNRGSSGSWHDMINTGEKESLIDCCVQMIINLKDLKERNLL